VDLVGGAYQLSVAAGVVELDEAGDAARRRTRPNPGSDFPAGRESHRLTTAAARHRSVFSAVLALDLDFDRLFSQRLHGAAAHVSFFQFTVSM
jgi:hypothetical protein